jgi:protease I
MATSPSKTVAMLIENNHNDHEVWYPIYRFQEAGAKVSVVGPAAQRYVSKLAYPIDADSSADAAKDQLFDVLIIPGGYAPDLMRLCPEMLAMVRNHVLKGKVVAAICHGSWLLASANVIKNRRVTGALSIKDDLQNAGGRFEDAEVVVDGTIVTSRKPSDLPAFCREILRLLLAEPLKASA